MEEDYADYIYVDDFNRYRTLQLEAEEFDDTLGPVASGSLKPQPFYGIRRPPRHKVEPKWLKELPKVILNMVLNLNV